MAYQHPVTWQPSKDGERLIGRILLNKRMKDGTVPADTGALLGLKVTNSSSILPCDALTSFCVQFSALLMGSVISGGWGQDDGVGASLCVHHEGEERKSGRHCGTPETRYTHLDPQSRTASQHKQT